MIYCKLCLNVCCTDMQFTTVNVVLLFLFHYLTEIPETVNVPRRFERLTKSVLYGDDIAYMYNL